MSTPEAIQTLDQFTKYFGEYKAKHFLNDRQMGDALGVTRTCARNYGLAHSLSLKKAREIHEKLEERAQTLPNARGLSPDEVSTFLNSTLKHKQIRKKDLRETMGISAASLSYYLQGQNLGTQETRTKVLDAFQIKTEEYPHFEDLSDFFKKKCNRPNITS